MPSVKVNAPSVIQVKVGNATNPQTTTISYGSQTNSLKNANDLNMTGAIDGGYIVYHANTGTFSIGSALGYDNGYF